MNPEERLTVAIVDDAHKTDTPQGRAIKRIIDGLRVCNSDHITQSCRGDDAPFHVLSYVGIMLLGTFLLAVPPLIFIKFRKPEWGSKKSPSK